MVGQFEESIRRTFRNVELAVRDGTMLIGHDGRIAEVSKIHEMLGIDTEHLVGGHPLPAGWTMFDESGAAVPATEHPALVAMRTGATVEQTLLYVRGGTHPVERRLRFVAHPVAGDADVAVDLVIADDERRQRTREMLESQESRFRTMTDMLGVAVWESTTTGEITYVNPKFTKLTGLTAANTPDLPLLEIVHPDDLFTVMGAANAAVDHGKYRVQYRMLHVDGSARWVTSQMNVLADDNGTITGFVGSIEDIDDLHRSEQRSRRLARIVEAAGDAVAIIDDGRLSYLNGAGRKLLARIDPEFNGEVDGYVPSAAIKRLRSQASQVQPGQDDWSSEFRLVDGAGVAVHLDLTVSAEQQRGDAMQHVLMARDVSAQKRREDALTHTAEHDALTGLANRQRLDAEFRRCEADVVGSLLYVDLDDFKLVNDQYGHAAGDLVLIAVAACLRSTVDSSALVARVGGDEMIVWAPGLTDAATLANRVVQAIADLRTNIDGVLLPSTATVGAAVGRAGDHLHLQRRADEALYTAKRAGRNRWNLAPG